MMNTVMLKDLKQGEFFKRTHGAKRVFIREHFNRKNADNRASIWCTDAEDIGSGLGLTPTTVVFINFDY